VEYRYQKIYPPISVTLLKDSPMPNYRRLKGTNVWHWCSNCTLWPTSNYIEVARESRPAGGTLDDECLAKETAGECGD
jgi:hypothetical protein